MGNNSKTTAVRKQNTLTTLAKQTNSMPDITANKQTKK